MLGVMAGAACNGGRPNLGPDEIPPELAFASEVPLYTRETSATLSVSAKDPSGVAKVWCQVGNGSAVAAERKEDGNHFCGVGLEQNAANALVIWAVDGAQNSGEGRDPPYMLVRAIVQAENALAVSLNGAAPATYYDESTMTVGTEVPPVYARNGAGFVVVTAGTRIHKAATRLASPTLTTGPGDLEEKNPDNLPWLQFAVSLTGAPITAGSYSIEAKSEGKTKTYSGDLIPWRSPQSADGATSGNVYFNLPLDSVRIPLLTSAAKPVAVKVTINVTDAAGNIGGDTVDLEYEAIGPPLNIVLDDGYLTANTRNSTYPYKIGNGTYGVLFDANDRTTFGDTQQVRLVRYVITNPSSQPVALDVSGVGSGSWTLTERWAGKRSGAEGQVKFNDSTCPGDNDLASRRRPMYTPPGGPTKEIEPGAGFFDEMVQVAVSSLFALAENRDASPVPQAGGRYIVPAASGSAPGVISLYVTRPLAVARLVALGAAPYTHEKGIFNMFVKEERNSFDCCEKGYRLAVYLECHWERWAVHGDFCDLGSSCSAEGGIVPKVIGYGTYCEPGPVTTCRFGKWAYNKNIGAGRPCVNCRGTCACSSWALAQTYNIYRYYQQLEAASEAVGGSFTPVTHATNWNGNVYGVPNPWAARIGISGSITH
jgi:hypothetical protein